MYPKPCFRVVGFSGAFSLSVKPGASTKAGSSSGRHLGMSPGKLYGECPFSGPVKSKRGYECAATLSPSCFSVVVGMQPGQCQQGFIPFFQAVYHFFSEGLVNSKITLK